MSEVPGQNLLSQLLGIDPVEAGKGKSPRQAPPAQGKMPSSATTMDAMKGVKLSSALKGLNITSNFMWLVLFVGFFLWLFVVYWIRHNEPFANHVLGPGAAHSATGRDDRVLVERMRNALPVQISKDTGFIYVPNKPDVSQFGQPTGMAPGSRQSYVPPAAAAAGPVVNSQIMPTQQQHPLQAPFAYQQTATPHYMPLAQPAAAPSGSIGYGSAYFVPHQTPDGARVKMIVNR